MKICLHWPADASGEGQTAFRDLPFAARDAVRKCSKSQVAVIARLRRPTITADASTSYRHTLGVDALSQEAGMCPVCHSLCHG